MSRETRLRRIGQAHLNVGLHRWQAILAEHGITDTWENVPDKTIEAIYRKMGLPPLLLPEPPEATAWRGGRD